VVVHAQESAAHEEMQATGSNAKNGELGQSAKHLYRASRDEAGDSAMTTSGPPMLTPMSKPASAAQGAAPQARAMSEIRASLMEGRRVSSVCGCTP